MEHNCQYVVSFDGGGENANPIFCDRPASIKFDGVWFCAEHYDLVMVRWNGECNCGALERGMQLR